MNDCPPAMPAADQIGFDHLLRGQSLAALWKVMGTQISAEPRPTCHAAIWRYADVRPLLIRAGEEITAAEAERRVLLFRNPGLDRPAITHTLASGLQLIKGGEVEGAHRHTQAALRLMIEGDGVYTAVDGERIWMRPGDVVTTPSWTWHDHGKQTEGPGIWLDGLDIPLVNYLQVPFMEDNHHAPQRLTRPDGDGVSRYASGILPLAGLPSHRHSPVFSYPYERTRTALAALARAAEWDRHHGLKVKFANPLTGGHVMPTIAAFMQLLPAGFATAPYRSTDAAVCSVVEGSGRVRIGDIVHEWAAHDVFVLPNWTVYTLEADSEAVLFSFSDRALQEAAGLWREDLLEAR